MLGEIGTELANKWKYYQSVKLRINFEQRPPQSVFSGLCLHSVTTVAKALSSSLYFGLAAAPRYPHIVDLTRPFFNGQRLYHIDIEITHFGCTVNVVGPVL